MNVKEYIAREIVNLSHNEKIKYAYRVTRNIIIHEIVGFPPSVPTFFLGWEQKKNHVREYINNYFSHNNKFPSGIQNVGNSFFPSVPHKVDFSEIISLLYHDMETFKIEDYPEWVRNEV